MFLACSLLQAGDVSTSDWVQGFSPKQTYRVPIAKGIFHTVSTDSDVTVQQLVARVTQPQNQENFVRKYMTKVEKERAYYNDRYDTEKEGEGADANANANANAKANAKAKAFAFVKCA